MQNKPETELDKILNQSTKADGPIHNGPFDSQELDLQMSMPHPKGRVTEMMAKAICAANHSSDHWQTLNDSDKEQFRVLARAAMAVVEPAIVWGHFVNMPQINGEEVIF